MANGSVAKLWAQFAVNVMPLDMSTTQKQEMRRAFYTGAWGMLLLLVRDDGRRDPLSRLKSLRRECEEFVWQNKKGET
jgi:hypothetical protein